MNTITKNHRKQLLSGNEAIALGAYHAGIRLAAAYPGTPSTEILENIARYEGVYAEWSTNEKVGLEIALGAAYTGVRSLTSMKHVGLNVAADPLFSASITGIKGGFVIVTADDPGMHSSQNEQDNRHYARFAKIPAIEPYDSQSAYDFVRQAFELSETFDTPVLFRSTTRISHSKSVVVYSEDNRIKPSEATFSCKTEKYVMLPVFARARHPVIEQRLERLKLLAEETSLNQVIEGSSNLGIITSGISFQYAREVFSKASFLRLGLTYPLPEKLIKKFAAGVETLLVVEELDPFLEEMVRSLGLSVLGKRIVPLTGELSPEILAKAASEAGLTVNRNYSDSGACPVKLPVRPPSMCPGCPHRGLFFELNRLGKRGRNPDTRPVPGSEPGLVITGDIGCYTLGAYPPLNAMDTCACMGAGIGQAIGMEKAGIKDRLVAVIGDSTFMHSGMTPLADAVYSQSRITVVILDNMTTAMTGHQGHPGTGISATGKKMQQVNLEQLVRGMGVEDVLLLDAFDTASIQLALRDAVESNRLSVLIVRGECAPVRPKSEAVREVVAEKCTHCKTCLKLACPAIQRKNGGMVIDPGLCAGDNCGICDRICPTGAIVIKGGAA